jgi:hypothetical protein
MRCSRRRALQLGAGTGLALGLGGLTGCGADPTDGGGGRVDAGPLDEVRAALAADGVLFVERARAYLVPVPADQLEPSLAAYPGEVHEGLRAGLLALHQECPHLGCDAPWCETSTQFECPCHSGIYSSTGEYRAGPADRGMDLRPVSITADRVVIDVRRLVRGLPVDVDVSGSQPTGPSCIP